MCVILYVYKVNQCVAGIEFSVDVCVKAEGNLIYDALVSSISGSKLTPWRKIRNGTIRRLWREERKQEERLREGLRF